MIMQAENKLGSFAPGVFVFQRATQRLVSTIPNLSNADDGRQPHGIFCASVASIDLVS